jgi:trafficking protein particle complex subunit 5
LFSFAISIHHATNETIDEYLPEPILTMLLIQNSGSAPAADASGVSLSAWAYLYSEMVQYHQNRVDSINELERRLEATGFGVGLRVLEILAYRSKEYKRETRLMNILQLVSSGAWKYLFGKAADSLERSIDHADEFMIVDYAPITR